MTLDQVRQRRANLEAIRVLGINPYPYAYAVTHAAREAGERFEELESTGSVLRIAGRIMSRRSHGKSTFVHLQDRSGRVQVYFKLDRVGEAAYALVKLLDIGDLVGLAGTLFRTRTGEITVEAREVTLLAKCLRPLPEKWHGLKDTETRYRQRYLDLIVNEETRRVFEIRAGIIRSLREYLDDRGFLEVDTPTLQPLYGGAFARPFMTHHDALDMRLYLRISDELYLKRLIVGGVERVYEIARDFRNEGIDRNHNPEFTMLEFYQAYADYNDVMRSTEEMLAEAIKTATGSYRTTFRGKTLDFTPPWDRVRYFDAVRESTGLDLAGADEEKVRGAAQRLGVDLEGKFGYGQIVDEIFAETVEANLIKPTFLTDFPAELSPLAKRHRDDERVVERFEVFAGGMELANAFSEQNDPRAQQEAFERQAELRERGDAEAQMLDRDYIRALEYGMPPTGGVGIGIDRLVMLATGMENIREVILFPQLRPEEGREAASESEDGEPAADASAEGVR